MIDNLLLVILVGVVLIATGGAVCGFLSSRKRDVNQERPPRRRLLPAVGRINCNGQSTDQDLGPPVDSPPPPPLPPRQQQPGGIFSSNRTNHNDMVKSNNFEVSDSFHHHGSSGHDAIFEMSEEREDNYPEPKRPSIFKDIDMRNYLAPGYSKVNKPKK